MGGMFHKNPPKTCVANLNHPRKLRPNHAAVFSPYLDNRTVAVVKRAGGRGEIAKNWPSSKGE